VVVLIVGRLAAQKFVDDVVTEMNRSPFDVSPLFFSHAQTSINCFAVSLSNSEMCLALFGHVLRGCLCDSLASICFESLS
jgi:hypothetical protein